MNIELLEQLASHHLARAPLEEHVVRHNDRARPVHLEQRLHVLEEVQLFVLRAGPEVLTLVGVRPSLQLAFFIDDLDRALLAEGRIGQNHREPLAGVACQAVHTGPNGARVRVDPVQVQVHDAEPGGRGNDVHSLDEVPAKMALLVRVQRASVLPQDMVVGGEQDAAGTAGGIAHRVVRPGLHDVDDRPDHFARGEVLPGCPWATPGQTSRAGPRRCRPSRRPRANSSPRDRSDRR